MHNGWRNESRSNLRSESGSQFSCNRTKWRSGQVVGEGMNEASNGSNSPLFLSLPFWQPYLPRQSTVSRTVSPLYVQCRLDAIKWASHHTTRYTILLVFREEGYRSVEGNVPRARTRPISFTVCLRSPPPPPPSPLLRGPTPSLCSWRVKLGSWLAECDYQNRLYSPPTPLWSIPAPLVNSLISLYELCIDFCLFNVASSKMDSRKFESTNFFVKWFEEVIVEFC